jgi:GrpB-like predicted nucleotidyltransferase (UPF0157 family)
MKRTNLSHTEIEDGINAVWGIRDILETIIWRYCDHPRVMTEDEVWNHLSAVSTLLELHCEKLMDTYCQVYELNEYASDEAKAYRDKLLNSAGVQKALKELKEEQNKKTKKAK